MEYKNIGPVHELIFIRDISQYSDKSVGSGEEMNKVLGGGDLKVDKNVILAWFWLKKLKKNNKLIINMFVEVLDNV